MWSASPPGAGRERAVDETVPADRGDDAIERALRVPRGEAHGDAGVAQRADRVLRTGNGLDATLRDRRLDRGLEHAVRGPGARLVTEQHPEHVETRAIPSCGART